MPIVRIEESGPREPEQKRAIVETVYAALKEVFGVSDEELQARYQSFAAEDFRAPGDREHYLHVHITLFQGRTLPTKRRLYRVLSERLSRQLGVPTTAILVLLDEHPAENWGMRGGIAACDIDFGYSVQV
ncbi:tautomerase family protein [Pseudomonas sp. RIT-PI-AD]|uniref:tautomerase family protein n=1 Tax=Pseudomonas sp. RIT-PI-AD TaxID=3035294 RepID=UPI0021D95145|nr:tautomerase family protein [Pseudomonas sp. RIT-PI-AD]